MMLLRRKLNGLPERRRQQQEQYAADAKALMEKLREYNAAELSDTLSKNDKEVYSLKNKYDKEIAETEASLKSLAKTNTATRKI